ncbi:MAG TPA: hypothetical protein DEG47_24955, partial [Cyanobacteria bacterium UBA11148]|nr:hypothetical protein [Cyanobacteria bacterium UBA11148]
NNKQPTTIPIFENIQFNRPVVVSETSPLTIRIAALVQESGKIEVVLRSEQTGFAIDHFRATCVWERDITDKKQDAKNRTKTPLPPLPPPHSPL